MSEDISGRPNYRLWHATCARHRDATTCTVDVTGAETVGLADGDRPLAAAMAVSLGLGTTRVRDWSVDRFVTPYYSYDPDADTWPDRLSLAWRVRLRLHGETARVGYLGLGPTRLDGLDPTWRDEDWDWTWETEKVVVVADLGPTVDLSWVRRVTPPATVEVLTYGRSPLVLTQARIMLPPADPQAAMSRVDAVLDGCRRRSMSVHWTAGGRPSRSGGRDISPGTR